MNNDKTPVISFVAKSGSGKTTLLEKVIVELKKAGIRIAVIKHDAHHFDMDKPGKDTWRMAQAGADVVAISAPAKVAMIEKVNEEKSLDSIIAMLPSVELILTEGYKNSGKALIEVSRSAAHGELLCEAHELLALASDIKWDIGVPCHHIDDVDSIVQEIRNYMSSLAVKAGCF